ncbi:aldo/keto reductase [bacterium]|nr:aldo/keto reductase [bacterium]
MEQVLLGKTGLYVSPICLGTMTYGDTGWRDWILDEKAGREQISYAYDLGINFFDTADMYSRGKSEVVLGNAIREIAPRDKVIIATKVYFPLSDDSNDRGLSRKHIMHAVDNSLKRLGTDYIDLYYIHRWNYATPIEETLQTLDILIKSGKVRYIGASSMFAFQLAKALYKADIHGWNRFSVMQNHYNLIYREEEREMNQLCVEEGIALAPWSPLARGYLAGGRIDAKDAPTKRAESDDYARKMYDHPNDVEVIKQLHEVANELGMSPSKLALAWLFHKPGVATPIIGTTKKAHIKEAVSASEVKLDEETMTRLEELYVPHAIKGIAPYGMESYR